MLSLFPHLFAFPLFAFFVLRLALAYQLGLIAKDRFKKPYSFIAVFEIAVTILITLGLYTQGALIGAMVLLIIESIVDRKTDKFDIKTAHLRTILGLVAFSLMFLGAGSPAFDLPL
ncbi:MAG: hypothetical protein NTV02_00205 [Candidatus Zambryskibacteria bacterium]|nr:hypothetical protein [Candidatus Zambryskibacteria bacterium]